MSNGKEARIKLVQTLFGQAVRRAEIQEILQELAGKGSSSRRSRERLDEVLNGLRSGDLDELVQLLAQPELAAAQEGASAIVELVKWTFEPTKYKEYFRNKDPNRADEWVVPEGESHANAPVVTASIVDASCHERGWLKIKIKVDARSGADKDDITEVRLALPSRDCNGYRDVGQPWHVFDEERESQTHTFEIIVKCSDLISRSDKEVDVFLWTELTVFDDDGNSRTRFMKLASPGLDAAARECCAKE